MVTALNDLAQNLERFSREDRRRLLAALAVELGRQQDLPGATRLWSLLAAQEPDDLDPRIQLLELAFQVGNQAEIEKNLKEIERIRKKIPVEMVVFDLLWIDGEDWTARPLHERRARLTEAVMEETEIVGDRLPDSTADGCLKGYPNGGGS